MIGFGLCGLLPKWLALVVMAIASSICIFIEASGYGIVQRGLFILISPWLIIILVISLRIYRGKRRTAP